MRCWVCHKIIIIPEIIDGRKGEPGEIRRAELKKATVDDIPAIVSKVAFTVTCPHCRTVYVHRVEQMAEKAPTKPDERTEEEKERDELWKR